MFGRPFLADADILYDKLTHVEPESSAIQGPSGLLKEHCEAGFVSHTTGVG